MLKEKLISLIVVGFILVIGGLFMIFSSINFGTSFADSWLISRGGADTGIYQIILKGYINNFLVAGGILFGFGLMLVILIFYKFQNIKEKTIHKM
ncbi:hypothetical protein FB550_10130 [Neobacillus bataviensis]|uniref:Uncharacterized protein n=1 Tax=Neobacillus bataviensis TaxID=220685 RepID=A0A561DXC6_9BACI|nr:hypothetical protein [Neobacillus bataviensis]TWE08019.1 hypothetical protein FB550_10130 [Neobacillus bataviensis]